MTNVRTWSAGPPSAGPRRLLQIALGVIWVLDAALQFQPYMFRRGFVTGVIEPAGSGSPGVIASSVTEAGHLILRDVPVFNAAFATLQLALGVALLWRPTVRAALAGTAAWALAVWWLGEGAGGILTGSASPLTGAPGAALLYVFLAVLLWPPREQRPATAAPPPASAAAASVAAGSVLGPRGSRLLWLVLWGSSAYFLVQGQVRAPGALSSSIAGLADGEPGWLAALDRATASAVGTRGGVISLLLAVLFALIAAAVCVPPATRPALVLAVLSAAIIWVLAENLGEMLTGTGTDPNTGPLLILLALAYWPQPDPPARARPHPA
jgi:hypothetical protein